MNSDDFHFIEVEVVVTIKDRQEKIKGFQYVHKESGKGFGSFFQERCRSLESKAALIVFEKYKRKHNLQHKDLISLREFAESFVVERKQNGKSVNQDFLVQTLSAELKRRVNSVVAE